MKKLWKTNCRARCGKKTRYGRSTAAVYIFICGIDHYFLHFWFAISFVSELNWLNPGKIKTTLRINKNRFIKSYLQMFSVWRRRPKIPLFWWMSRIKKRRGCLFILESLGFLQRILVQKRRCCSSFPLFAKQNKKKFTLRPCKSTRPACSKRWCLSDILSVDSGLASSLLWTNAVSLWCC